MNTCHIVKRGHTCLHLSIGGEKCKLDTNQTMAFERAMELRGWSAQRLFEHLMSRKMHRPWNIIDRLGRKLVRQKILKDMRLGPLMVQRNFAGELQACRFPKRGSISTSFTPAPRSWYPRFEHIKNGQSEYVVE